MGWSWQEGNEWIERGGGSGSIVTSEVYLGCFLPVCYASNRKKEKEWREVVRLVVGRER